MFSYLKQEGKRKMKSLFFWTKKKKEHVEKKAEGKKNVIDAVPPSSWRVSIPQELYLAIKEYLKELDYLRLMNSSQTMFKEIKYETRKIILLERKDARAFFENVKYEAFIYSKINSPYHQLSVPHHRPGPSSTPYYDFKYIYSPEVHSKERYMKYLRNRRSFNVDDNSEEFRHRFLLQMTELCIISSRTITRVNSLAHLQVLVLKSCYSLVDVSCLSKVHVLEISYCPKVTNVHELGNVYNLTLISCPGITQINELKNNHCLKVTGCDSIVDRRPLWNAIHLQTDCLPSLSASSSSSASLEPNTLNLETFQLSTTTNTNPLPIRTKFLILKGFKGEYFEINNSSTSEHSLWSISIINCAALVKLPDLTGIHSVTIQECNRLVAISGLGSNTVVSIDHCTALQGFSALQNNIRSISIENCRGFNHVDPILNAHHVRLKGCRSLRDVSRLEDSNIYHLELVDCSVRSLEGVESISIVEIIDCHALSNLTGLTDKHKTIVLSLPLFVLTCPGGFPYFHKYEIIKDRSEGIVKLFLKIKVNH
jgi:hypothetical protein